MATMQKQNDPNQMPRSEAQRRQEQGDIGSPISNQAYNVISSLHAKLEGLEAYRKYSHDEGNREIWKQMCDADVRCVELLVDELEKLVHDGKLRVDGQAKTQKPRA